MAQADRAPPAPLLLTWLPQTRDPPTDGCATWSTVGLPTTEAAQHLAFSGDDLYAAAGADLWKLADVGSGSAPQVVWTMPGQFSTITGLAGRDGAVAASGYDAAQHGARTVAISSDGGSTWQTSAPSPTTVISELDWVGEDLFASAIGQSWELAAGSDTWAPVTGLTSGSRRFSLLGGHRVVAVSGVGLYRTTDGATYDRIGVSSTMITALGIASGADGTHRLVAATSNGTFGTPVPESEADPALRDWGRNGTETAIGKSEVSLSVDPAHPQVVYEAQRNAFSRFDIEKSTDGGQTWAGVESSRTSSIPYQVAMSPADPSYVYVTEQDPFGYGVLVTTDGGSSWRRYASTGAVTAVAPDPRHPRSVLLGGPDGLYRSTDGGQSETRLSSTPVNAIAMDPRDPSHVVVAGPTIATSTDGGATLREARTDPGRMLVSSLAFVGRTGVCAATSSYSDDAGLLVDGRGVLCSRDSGHSWHNVSGDLPYRSISSLAVSPDGRWLYAGSLGQGVYRTGVRSVLP